jgi:Putative peptidoglycan binding domain
MRRFTVLAFGLTGVLTIGVHPVAGQINAPVVQNSSNPGVSHGARATAVHSGASAPQNFARGPMAVGPRLINAHPGGIPHYSGMSPRRNYSPSIRSLNPSLAAMNARQSARIDPVQPTSSLSARNEFRRNRLAFANGQNDNDTRDHSVQPTAAMLARRQLAARSASGDLTEASLTTTQKDFDVERPATSSQVPHGALAPRETLHSAATHNWKERDNRLSFSDARRCHWHEWHDRDWWRQHCTTIVFVNSGYYFLDAGYWYPAFGYDPLNSYYDYDGPVYTYGNLLPDEVITNVQVALQDAGYYFGQITGSLDVETRAALANFQRDYGLPITGAIDQPTIETLGLY